MRSILLISLLLWLGPAAESQSGVDVVSPIQQTKTSGYVGSQACAGCHRSIYKAFSQTDMGRSMSIVANANLSDLPNSVEFFSALLNRHFSVSIQNAQLYESEWETNDGKDVFRETQRIDWLIGAGTNGIGALVRRGNQVFEAPVTYYTKIHAWALSPGYEDSDRGFSRPIDAGCISCHSGRPNPITIAAGKFGNPPFYELSIGCENCHGPGSAHVREMRAQKSFGSTSTYSIVNPGRLSPQLADNICMFCHQTGDARVLQPGKTFQDLRPGQPLDHTLALFMVPPTPENPPRSDLVQQYFSMTLSKCYRASGQKLSCITCHNPHVQPSSEEASAFYRKKCLLCHSNANCTLPVEARQKTTPADNCIGCHMPKRDVTEISHASLTNHRIVRSADEPFPGETFHLATDGVQDLVHLDPIPGESESLAPITLLQVYGQLSAEHREYVSRYLEVGKQLEATEGNNTNVLEALAAESLQLRTAEGDKSAIDYLERAIRQGSTTAWDFELLGSKLLQAHSSSEAIASLREGIERAPYDAKIYTLLAEAYVAVNDRDQADAILTRALEMFPQMDLLRGFLKQIRESARAAYRKKSSQ